MKISAKQYAITLFDLLKDTPDNRAHSVIEKFAGVLFKNNDTAQAEKIINYFNSFWNKNNGIIDVEVVSAHELNDQLMASIKKHVLKISGAKDLNLKTRIDRKILGGIVLKYDDKILDASLKNKMMQFAQKMKS